VQCTSTHIPLSSNHFGSIGVPKSTRHGVPNQSITTRYIRTSTASVTIASYLITNSPRNQSSISTGTSADHSDPFTSSTITLSKTKSSWRPLIFQTDRTQTNRAASHERRFNRASHIRIYNIWHHRTVSVYKKHLFKVLIVTTIRSTNIGHRN
jgi:hypothetical protein